MATEQPVQITIKDSDSNADGEQKAISTLVPTAANHTMSNVLEVFFDNKMSEYLTIPELRCLGATEPLSNRVTVRADGKRLLQSDLAIRTNLSKILKEARGNYVKMTLVNGNTLSGILLKYSRQQLTLRVKLSSGGDEDSEDNEDKDDKAGGKDEFKGLRIKFTQLVDVVRCSFSWHCSTYNIHEAISSSHYISNYSFLQSKRNLSSYETQVLPTHLRCKYEPMTWWYYKPRGICLCGRIWSQGKCK